MLRFFDNIWIKLVALAMGLLLWFHVATEKRYNYQLSLPVKEIVLKADLTLAKYPPDSITVVVSANGKQLLRRQWRERGLKVNALQFQTGNHEVMLSSANVSLVGDDMSMSLTDVLSPNSITLEIDHLARAEIPVICDLYPDPADGFAVDEITAPEPPVVSVSGPRSLLNRIKSVFTERKELTGIRNDIPLTVALQIPAGYGVAVEPDSVSVTVRVVPVKTRVIANVPVVIFNVPPNTRVQPLPPVVKVEISGPPGDVDSLSSTTVVASVDYATRSADGNASISVQCPTLFKVKNVSSTSIRLIEN